MVPGLGAAVRLGKGFQERKQIESRIQELEGLWNTPAPSHYEGVKRFEVAAVLCDAKLGLILESEVDQEARRKAIEEYLDAMGKEYEMVLKQARSTPATKAEVYALGLALKEVALSFDETSAEFRATSDEQLAELGAALELVRRTSAAAIADFSRTSGTAIEQLNDATRSALLELTRKADARMAKADGELQDRLARLDLLLAASNEESTNMLTEIRASAGEALANIEHQVEATTANVARTITDQYQDVQKAVARAHAETAASLRSLKSMVVLMGIVAFVAAVLVGRLLGP